MPRKKIEINPESGKRLKLWLSRTGISARLLCETLNYSEPYMSDVVRGKRRLTPELAEAIAKIPMDIPITERVRSDYLLLKDDFMTVADQIKANVESKHDRRELVLQLFEFHGYTVIDVTADTRVLTDENGNEYQMPTFAMVSSEGGTRFFSQYELLSLIDQVDSFAEMLCAFQFRGGLNNG